MPEPYSLAGRAWIPVALSNGQRAFIRPCEISETYEGHTILRIATGRADCDISLTEFLIGLLAVTMAPPGPIAWKKRYRTPPTRDELSAAFARLEPALRLDGDGPRFFQDRDPLEGKPNGIDALFIDAPGDSTIQDNADHFVKRGRTSALSRAGAAIALATLQTCAPSGGAGHRTSLRGGGPLTTLVVPGGLDGAEPTLWQTLWANVPERLGLAEEGDLSRVFPWLGKTRISDKTGIATTPDDVHPAQAFFGMPRRIRLVFEPNTQGKACDLLGIVDDTIVTEFITRPWGTNYTAWSRGHPLSPYYLPKANAGEHLPVHLQSSRVGYRQYLALVHGSGDDNSRLPAACVNEFFKRAQNFDGAERSVLRNCRLLAAGYAMDNMKPLDFGEALMPLIVTGHPKSDACIADFARGFVQAAELMANHLTNCVKRGLYGEKLKADRDSTPLEAVRQNFWGDTDQSFYRELQEAARQLSEETDELVDRVSELRREAGMRWLAVLREAALCIFDSMVPIDDAESERIKDVIEARKSLVLALTGHGPLGRQVFGTLGLPAPERKGRKAA
jgi:CRISPR system Cascade subunit CasA